MRTFRIVSVSRDDADRWVCDNEVGGQYMGLIRCKSVFESIHFNLNISKTSRSIAIKFYLKHHWGMGNATLCFETNGLKRRFP